MGDVSPRRLLPGPHVCLRELCADTVDPVKFLKRAREPLQRECLVYC